MEWKLAFRAIMIFLGHRYAVLACLTCLNKSESQANETGVVVLMITPRTTSYNLGGLQTTSSQMGIVGKNVTTTVIAKTSTSSTPVDPVAESVERERAEAIGVLHALRMEVDAREEGRKKAMNLSQMARAGVLERVQRSDTRVELALEQLNASKSVATAMQALAVANALVRKLVHEDDAAQLTYKRAINVHANMTRLAQKALQEQLAELAKIRNASREHAKLLATIKQKLKEEAQSREAAENYSHATKVYERASAVAIAAQETKEKTSTKLKAVVHRLATQKSEVTRLELLKRQASMKMKQSLNEQANAENAVKHALVEWNSASATARKAKIEASRAQIDATKAIDEAAKAEKLGMNMTVWTAAAEGKTAAYEPERAPNNKTNMDDLFKFQHSTARAAAQQALETKRRAAAEARKAARDMALALARSRRAERDKERARAQAVSAAVVRKQWEAKLRNISEVAGTARTELLRIQEDLADAQSADTAAVNKYRRTEKELQILKAHITPLQQKEAAARAAARSAERLVRSARAKAQTTAKQMAEAKARAKQSAQLARDTLGYSKTWVKTMLDAKNEAKKASHRLTVAKERQDVAEAAATQAERTQTWIRHHLQHLEFLRQLRVMIRVLDALLLMGLLWAMVGGCYSGFAISGARNYRYSRLKDKEATSDVYPSPCSILMASAFIVFACAPVVLKVLNTRTGCSWMAQTKSTECSISPLALPDLFCLCMMVCLTKFATFLSGMSSNNYRRRRIDWCNWALSLSILLHAFLAKFVEHFVTEDLWARSLVNGEAGVIVFAAAGAPDELLHKFHCLKLQSSNSITSMLPLLFGWPLALTFSLGAVLICLGDAMILVGEKDFDQMNWLDSCVLKVATTRKLAGKRTCDLPPPDRPTKLVLHRLVKVVWPFWLQAFGLTLWLPVDLLRTQPCLGFNEDVTSILSTIVTTFGVSVVSNSDYLVLLWKCTLGVAVVVLALIVCQHAAGGGAGATAVAGEASEAAGSFNMKVLGNISVLIWCIVVAYCSAFGTFFCSTRYTIGPDVGEVALGIIDWTSAHLRQIWLCVNAVQTLVLCLSLNNECMLSWTISEEERQELETDPDPILLPPAPLDDTTLPIMDQMRKEKQEVELQLRSINEEKQELQTLLSESIDKQRKALREKDDQTRSNEEQKGKLMKLQNQEREWERKQAELQAELSQAQNLQNKGATPSRVPCPFRCAASKQGSTT